MRILSLDFYICVSLCCTLVKLIYFTIYPIHLAQAVSTKRPESRKYRGEREREREREDTVEGEKRWRNRVLRTEKEHLQQGQVRRVIEKRKGNLFYTTATSKGEGEGGRKRSTERKKEME